MDFDSRYAKLNAAQKEAVNAVEGAVMVVAGPGTGKTELLSMRTAQILRKTDANPDNILLLTFTDSAANSMRRRLTSIIGTDANKVAIHTFHSFASEVINQHREHFYSGANYTLADDITRASMLSDILAELDYDNILASRRGNDFTYRSDIAKAIGELKKSGLTSDELLAVLDSNERVVDTLEPRMLEIFNHGLPRTFDHATIQTCEELYLHASNLNTPTPNNLVPLDQVFAHSLRQAIDAASDLEKLKPLNDWRGTWLEGKAGERKFKLRKVHEKLRALARVYYQYLTRMDEARAFDYDDMLLQLVHTLETQTNLRAELQEKYQYIMVDEFQDTNLGQMRILYNLAENPIGDPPNIMTVGDDDQAIYAFQGAEVANILTFADRYPGTQKIVLTENYRSKTELLELARGIITQADGRLENKYEDVDKTLSAASGAGAEIALQSLASAIDERDYIITEIAKKIEQGVAPHDIAVIARNHKHLEPLATMLSVSDIRVSYEKRSSILDLNSIVLLEKLARFITALSTRQLKTADAMLPEILAHPALGIHSSDLYTLSVKAYDSKRRWLDTMQTLPNFKHLAEWFIELSQESLNTPLEYMLDTLLNRHTFEDGSTIALVDYFWSTDMLDSKPEKYIEHLEALRTLREHILNYKPGQNLKLADFTRYIDLARQLGVKLENMHRPSESLDAVHLLTAHKAKGMEFEHVYVMSSNENVWGASARSKNDLINYAPNMPLRAGTNTYDERLRLFYVALTRAKTKLTMTYHLLDDMGRGQDKAGFITEPHATHVAPSKAGEQLVTKQEQAWFGELIATSHELADVLAPTLERYKLSATHLNAFTDLENAGPSAFVLQNLLKFPSAPNEHLAFGNAIHGALQTTQTHLTATGALKATEDIIADFERILEEQRLPEQDFTRLSERGARVLTRYMSLRQDNFSSDAVAELNFAGQNAVAGDARLTGKLDLVEIDKAAKTIRITDYKTGKSISSLSHANAKAHRYKQQLIFYKLLVENSADYSNFTVENASVQFVEPDQKTGDIIELEMTFTQEDVDRMQALVAAIWRKIMTLDFPDTSSYKADYKGILAFEDDLINGRV